MKIAVLASLTPEHSQLDFYTSDHAQILTNIANMVSAKIADAIKTEELHNTARQLEISQGILIEKTTELLSSRNAEQAPNRTKSEYLSTMSHEVRTSMNSIIGMADLLAIDASLDEIQKKQVDILKNAGFSLLHLINQIIDLTKLDAHEVLLDEKEVHLQNLITKVCNFANQSDALGREPTVIDIKPILPESITIDETQFKKILVSLLTNASKFSEHEDVYLTLDLDSWQPNHTLLLFVKCHSIYIKQLVNNYF